MSTTYPGGITVLKGHQAIRKRPHLYVGDPARGTVVLDMVLEDILIASEAGASNILSLFIFPDRIELVDDGPGWDVSLTSHGTCVVEEDLNCLRAGLGASNGLPVLVGLSSKLDFATYTDGEEWRQSFVEGVATTEFHCVGKTDRHGAKLTFVLDPTVLNETELDLEALKKDYPTLTILDCRQDSDLVPPGYWDRVREQIEATREALPPENFDVEIPEF